MTVRNTVLQIIADQSMLQVEDLNDDDSLADIGIDNLGVVEAIFAIEEAFDVSVPFNANEPEKSSFDISSISAIVTAVEQLVESQKG